MIVPIVATLAPASNGTMELLRFYVPYQIGGFLVVIFTLAVLYGICAFTGSLFIRLATRVPQAEPLSKPAPTTAKEEANDPLLIAVISAAVAVTLEQSHRIVALSAAAQPPPPTSAWAIEGRFQHFSSHKFR